MLVLERKANQRICISGGIVIEIVKVADKKVRVGITAPDDVRVLREEIVDKATTVDKGGSGSAT